MAALEGVRGRMMVRLASWFDRELSGPVLAGAFNDSLRAGGLRGAQPLRELSSVRPMLTGGGLFPLFDSPWVPVLLVLILLLHWTLGLILLLGGGRYSRVVGINILVTPAPV